MIFFSARPVRLLCLFYLLSAVFCHSRADSFNFQEKDKQLHMAVSYGMGITLCGLMPQRWTKFEKASVAFLLTLAVGASKEFMVDRYASGGDMVADSIGAGAAGATFLTFDLF